MTTERRPRVLLAKPGLDGHDRGVKVVAIVSVAAQEAVDAIGLSILSGSHLPICERMRELIEAAGLEDKLWIVGGNIPHGDRVKLERLGVSRVFPTGTPFAEIVGYLKEQLP
jgi:methylmalonyl-CoA mutase C-terminal domain/subunit